MTQIRSKGLPRAPKRMKLAEKKIRVFLDELAGKKAAPGGGSAAALAGAMAASLVVMVAEFTIGKEKYKDINEEMEKVRNEGMNLKDELLELVDEDTRAYLEVMKTKGGQAATLKAAEVPLSTAQKSLSVLKMAVWASEIGNQNLRSDAFCAIELATAAIYGALENVRVNLPYLKNQKVVNSLKDEIEEILTGANQFVKS